MNKERKMEKIKNAIKRWSKQGMHWPFVYDPVENKPSVTLMFFYIAFTLCVSVVAVSSYILLKKDDPIQATFMPSFLMLMGFVFYRLRKLDNVKIDLDDKKIELSSQNEKEESKDDDTN